MRVVMSSLCPQLTNAACRDAPYFATATREDGIDYCCGGERVLLVLSSLGMLCQETRSHAGRSTMNIEPRMNYPYDVKHCQPP